MTETNDSPLEIEFSEDILLWFMAFVDWDDEFNIVGLFETEEEAQAKVTDAALEEGYFWICPLQLGVCFGSPEDILRDCEERVMYIYKYTERPVQAAVAIPPRKVDRKHLNVIK